MLSLPRQALAVLMGGILLPSISTRRIRITFSGGTPNGLSPNLNFGQDADVLAPHGDGLVQESHLFPRHSVSIIAYFWEGCKVRLRKREKTDIGTASPEGWSDTKPPQCSSLLCNLRGGGSHSETEGLWQSLTH